MNYEFQAVYLAPDGRLDALNVVARDEAEVKSLFEELPHELKRVEKVRALLDWNQKNFTREEAGEYLRRSGRTVTRLIQEGRLSRDRMVYTRVELDDVIAEGKAA